MDRSFSSLVPKFVLFLAEKFKNNHASSQGEKLQNTRF
jgi:hypothetical protein